MENLHHSYVADIKELYQNHAISPDERVLFYFDHRLRMVFDHIFSFCRQHLSETCLKRNYNIEPARFYFRNSAEFNAAAWPRVNGYFKIAINRGTIEQLFAKFYESDTLNDPRLSKYKALNEVYKQHVRNDSVSYLMFQSAVIFVYYHELSHLIQFANMDFIGGPLQERHLPEDNKFDMVNHVIEYDADSHGGQELAAHILDYWADLPEKYRTDDSLKDLLVVSLVGVLGYCVMLLDNPQKGIYFYKYTHPHPLIRLVWIALALTERVKAYFPQVVSVEIVKETMRVIDIYFPPNDSDDTANVPEKARQSFAKLDPKIMTYVKDIIETANGTGYEYLVTNTIHRSQKP